MICMSVGKESNITCGVMGSLIVINIHLINSSIRLIIADSNNEHSHKL